jgi:hypothetical protein
MEIIKLGLIWGDDGQMLQGRCATFVKASFLQRHASIS